MGATDFDTDIAIVTGANGGLGSEFVWELLARGARRVYATARTPREWGDSRIVPLTLDVTDHASITAAVDAARDVTLVINNAGIAGPATILTGDFDRIREIFETNFFGPIHVARGFAPVLADNGGGAILNVLSVLSWISFGGAYEASKAALWSATNGLRGDVAYAGTHVAALHVGFTRTGLTAHRTGPMNEPSDIVRIALDGLARGEHEIIADDYSAEIKSKLSAPITVMYPELL